MKKLTALALALTLALTPALAAGEYFPATREYPGYGDVAENDWFYANAKLCYEIGLMNGTDKGFEPNKTLTVSECATVAARMREVLTGEAIPAPVPDPSLPWYHHYLEYMRAAQPSLTPVLAHPEEPCSRAQYLQMLGAAIPEGKELLTPINAITTLPDTDDSTVLAFYNAGILTGIDKQGTFAGERTLMRSECAAMVSRIARNSLRMTFVPETAPVLDVTALSLEAAYLDPGAVVLVGVTSEQFLAAVNPSITRWETALGDNFNWHADAGDGKTVLNHVKEESLSALGVAEDQGGELYKNFDYQVYYARLIDRLGGPLG